MLSVALLLIFLSAGAALRQSYIDELLNDAAVSGVRLMPAPEALDDEATCALLSMKSLLSIFKCEGTDNVFGIDLSSTGPRRVGSRPVFDFVKLSDAYRTRGNGVGDLKDLNLANVGFNGTIPSELTQFTGLTSLNLSRNSYSSMLPVGLIRLSSLTSVDVSHNDFSGSLAMFAVPTLRILHAQENKFSQFASNQFTQRAFASIQVYNNSFSGTMPALSRTPISACTFQAAGDTNCFRPCNVTTCCRTNCSAVFSPGTIGIATTPPFVFVPGPIGLAPTPATVAGPPTLPPAVTVGPPTLPPAVTAPQLSPKPTSRPAVIGTPPTFRTVAPNGTTIAGANETAAATTRTPSSERTIPIETLSESSSSSEAALSGGEGLDQSTQIAIGVGVGGGLLCVLGAVLAVWLLRRSKPVEPPTPPATASPRDDFSVRRTSSRSSQRSGAPRRTPSLRLAESATPTQYGSVPDLENVAKTPGRNQNEYVPVGTANTMNTMNTGSLPRPGSNDYVSLPGPRHADSEYVPIGNASMPPRSRSKTTLRKKTSRRGQGGSKRNLQSSMPRSVDTVRDIWQIEESQLVLGHELGKGAFGVVVRAQWKDKVVAVKQIRSDAVGGTKAVLEFKNEVKRMAALPPHKNVVQLFGVSKFGNDLAAVVEFCSKGALSEALYGDQPTRFSPPQLLSIARDSAYGIRHLHDNGVVHRDIAARNVLLADGLVAKVADFGMSRGFDASATVDENVTVQDVGPLRWQAPEQMIARKYSRASDVWAFGVLCFEIFCQELPWSGVGNMVVAQRVMNGEHLHGGVSTPTLVKELMDQCFAREASARPTMKDVCAVFDRLVK